MKRFENDNEKRSEFIDDWNAMVETVARFGDKYDLPKGELIFPPVVLDNLRDAVREHILGTIIYKGVRIRFGVFELLQTFREY